MVSRLGRETETNQTLVGASTGVFKVTSIQRMAPEDRFDQKLFSSFSSTPWNHRNDGKFYPQFILPRLDRAGLKEPAKQ